MLRLNQPIRNLIIFFIALIFYLLVVEHLIQHTAFALPLQLLEANIVASTQALAGADVHAAGIVLSYPDQNLHLIIGPLCVGIREMFLFAIIILPLGILSLRKRLRSLAIFLPIILVENIVRLWMLYPLAQSYGIERMEVSHDLMWTYGQMIFLLLLLFIWYYFFSGIRPSGVKESSSKNKKDDSNNPKV